MVAPTGAQSKLDPVRPRQTFLQRLLVAAPAAHVGPVQIQSRPAPKRWRRESTLIRRPARGSYRIGDRRARVHRARIRYPPLEILRRLDG